MGYHIGPTKVSAEPPQADRKSLSVNCGVVVAAAMHGFLRGKFALVVLLGVGTFVAACDSSAGGEPVAGAPSATPSSTLGSTDASGSIEMLTDGSIATGRYIIRPPGRFGWAECVKEVRDCPPPPPHAKSLRVQIEVSAGWEAGFDSTVLALKDHLGVLLRVRMKQDWLSVGRTTPQDYRAPHV